MEPLCARCGAEVVAHPYRDAGRPPPPPSSWPKRIAAAIATIAVLALLPTLFGGTEATMRQRWTFLEGRDPGELGLASHAKAAGDWTLEDHGSATGGRLLVNGEGDQGASPALLVAPSLRARDVRVATRCKASSACGVTFRFVDVTHHSVARLDVAGRAIEVVAIDGASERVLGRAPAELAPDVWQEISVEARGDRIAVSLNGREVVRVTELVPATPGTIGLWAPAPGRAYFDELVVETLVASPQAFEILPLVGRRAS
jgi:hypothetical protein